MTSAHHRAISGYTKLEPFIRQHIEGQAAAAATVTITLQMPPLPGNILIAHGNCKTTLVTPTGTTSQGNVWTAGPTQTTNNKTYSWWKICNGLEGVTAIFTPLTSVQTTCGLIELQGVSGFDVSGSNVLTVTGTATTSLSITPTTQGDILIIMAMLIGYLTLPSAPSWTNGYVEQFSLGTAVNAANAVNTFVAAFVQGSAGAAALASVCSWTNTANNSVAMALSFKAA